MKHPQKALFLLVFLLSFTHVAWTQIISVSNANELQAALSNGTINLINLGGDISLNSELVCSQPNTIDLNGRTLDCGRDRVRLTGGTLVIQSSYEGGTIIGRGADAGCAFYIESGATLEIGGTISGNTN